MPDRDKVRIGILGCANVAARSVVPAFLASNDFDVVAAASRELEKAQAFCKPFGCEAVHGYAALVERNDLDAVYVPLPTGLHEEWVVRALEAGKHVFTEKSLAVDLVSACKMLAIAKARRLVLMEDFMYRYHSQHEFVWDHLRRGTIGDIRLVRATFGFPPLAPDNFRYQRELGGGVVFDAAAYTVNLARWMLGNDLEVASADLAIGRREGVGLYGSATLRSAETGITAQLAFGFRNFYRSDYELWGTGGCLYVDRAYAKPATLAPRVRISRQDEITEYVLKPDDHFIKICSEFAACIRSGAYDKHYADVEDQSRVLTSLEQLARKTYV